MAGFPRPPLRGPPLRVLVGHGWTTPSPRWSRLAPPGHHSVGHHSKLALIPIVTDQTGELIPKD